MSDFDIGLALVGICGFGALLLIGLIVASLLWPTSEQRDAANRNHAHRIRGTWR